MSKSNLNTVKLTQKENKVEEKGIADNIINSRDDESLKDFCKNIVNDFFKDIYKNIKEDPETSYNYSSYVNSLNDLYKIPALYASEKMDYKKIEKIIDEVTILVFGDNVSSHFKRILYKANIRNHMENRTVSSGEFGPHPSNLFENLFTISKK